MKVSNIGDFIKYIRNKILIAPSENLEGDDLRIDFYDDEIDITVNEFYGGPRIIYWATKQQTSVFFNNCEMEDEKTVVINTVEEVTTAARICELIEDNKEMLNKFIKREE